MIDTKPPVWKMRVILIVALLVGASCIPLWYQHAVAGKDWKVHASGSNSDTWYDPITGYYVKEQDGGYTYSIKHEFAGDFVAHSALITGRITKDGHPAAGIEVYFGIDAGPHYGQLGIATETGKDGTAQVVLPNDGQMGTDLVYMAWNPTRAGPESEDGIPLDTRRRSVVKRVPWGNSYIEIDTSKIPPWPKGTCASACSGG